MSDEQRAEYAVLRSRIYGSTLDGLISMVSTLANRYFDSYRNNDDTGNDGAFHNTLRRIMSGQERDRASVERALSTIRYRMDQMLTADTYLLWMNVPAPDQLLCRQFDTNRAHHRMPIEKYHAIKKLIFGHRVLFPPPAVGQGWSFYKGHDYVTEAFHKANIPLNIVAQKLDSLAAVVELGVDLSAQWVLGDPEMAIKTRMLPETLGV